MEEKCHMRTNASMNWLRRTVSHIRFPPDRKRAEEELYEHMILRNRDFLEEGMDEKTADEAVVACAGDADEVGRWLGKLHRPVWGYLLLTLRLLIVVCLLAVAVTAIRGGYRQKWEDLRSLTRECHGPALTWREQVAEAKSGDYRFRLRKAAITDSENGETLLIMLDEWHIDPFLSAPRTIPECITVADSLGNEYIPEEVCSASGVFTARWLLRVSELDPAAKWAELRYERYGAAFRLPVALGRDR